MINWEKLYYKLLNERSEKSGENHHVIPKHAGGLNEDGLVILSHKNHVVAHYIRWRWKGEYGDLAAYKMMAGQEKNPMHIPEMRDRIIKKGAERMMKWRINNPDKFKESSNRGRQTQLKAIKKMSNDQLKERFGYPGDKNPNWECYYIIFKEGAEVKFESQAHLLRETKISRLAVNKYKDTDIEIPRGKLKGYKIKTTKLK